jgi:hypothetical protein
MENSSIKAKTVGVVDFLIIYGCQVFIEKGKKTKTRIKLREPLNNGIPEYLLTKN